MILIAVTFYFTVFVFYFSPQVVGNRGESPVSATFTLESKGWKKVEIMHHFKIYPSTSIVVPHVPTPTNIKYLPPSQVP